MATTKVPYAQAWADPGPTAAQDDPLKVDSADSRISKASIYQKSRATSCERCKRRKQKCDHRLPVCTNCYKAGVSCVQPERYAQSVPVKDQYTIMLEETVSSLKKELSRTRSDHGASHHHHSSSSFNGVKQESPLLSSAGATPTAANAATVESTGSAASTGGGSYTGSASSTNPFYSVNILHADPSSGASAPQSFSVVSSLLRESSWGRHDSTQSRQNVGGGPGLLPDYSFEPYLSFHPVEVPDDAIAQSLLEGYLEIQGKIPFVDRNFFIRAHEQRHKLPSEADDPNYRFNNFVLFAIYALTIMMPIPSAKSTELDAKRYYSTALRHAKLCKTTNPIWQIKALWLCATYQMRTDVDEGCHFDMITRCMKLCYDVGLHEDRGSESLSLYDQEMRKRLFWAVYGSERLYAISTGRPFSIAEEDVRVELPVDLDFEDLTEEKIAAARVAPDLEGSTHMTFTRHVWRLRRLEADMVTHIYQKDRPLEEVFSQVDYYLRALDQWRDNHVQFKSREQYVATIAYSKAVRLLLQPFLARLDPTGPLFQKCVVETGRICFVFRDFYRKFERGFTTLAMHTNFIAGLTLIYCLWLSKDTDFLPILESIRLCSLSLYVLTERSRLCRNYRDTFENLVSATIQTVNEHVQHLLMGSRPADTLSNATPPSSASQLASATSAGAVTPATLISDGANGIVLGTTAGVPPASTATAVSKPESLQPFPSPAPAPASGADTQVNSNVNGSGPIGVDAAAWSPTVSAAQNVGPPPESGPWVAPGNPGNSQITSRPIQGPPVKEWVDSYGYDDSMFNMIQDISSWTKKADPGQDTSQVSDYMWMNLTDFSLT